MAGAFENAVNVVRGWVCLLITLGSFALVCRRPKMLLFWRYSPFHPTGIPGFLISLSFCVYLALDSLVAVVWRKHFRRARPNGESNAIATDTDPPIQILTTTHTPAHLDQHLPPNLAKHRPRKASSRRPARISNPAGAR